MKTIKSIKRLIAKADNCRLFEKRYCEMAIIELFEHMISTEADLTNRMAEAIEAKKKGKETRVRTRLLFAQQGEDKRLPQEVSSREHR